MSRSRGAVVGAAAFLAVFTPAYFVVACATAARRPYWADEIFTVHLARVPAPKFWDALANGPDVSGPINLLAVRLSYALLGEGPVSTRLPAIVGVWAMVLGVLVVAGRRLPAPFAWAAALLPLATHAYSYIYEARPYGPWLGLTGLALLAWQLAADGRCRAVALPALALAMAGSIACHYYAVLVLAALGLGELARTWERRRFDAAIWAALVASLAALVPLLPAIRGARSFTKNFFSPPSLLGGLRAYNWLLDDAVPALAGVLGLLGLVVAYSRRRDDAVSDAPPRHEVVAAVGLMALPVMGVILGKLATGAYLARYGLPAVLGFALAVAFLASRLPARPVGPALVAALAAWLAASAYGHYALGRGAAGPAGDNPYGIPTDGPPVATVDVHLYIETNFLAAPAINDRLTYLTGLEGSTDDPFITRLAPWVGTDRPVRHEDVAAYLAGHDRFLIIGGAGGATGSLARRLRSEGVELALRELRGTTLILEATRRGAAAGPPGAGPRPGGS